MSRLFHIGLNYQNVAVQPDNIDTALTLIVEDWIRYSPCCWVIWTSKSAQSVLDELKPHISLSQSIFISKMDTSDYAGYMPQWTWDWIQNKLFPVNSYLTGSQVQQEGPLFPTGVDIPTTPRSAIPDPTNFPFGLLGHPNFDPKKRGG